MTLAIAIVALLLSCYAVYLCLRAGISVDYVEGDDEEEPEEEEKDPPHIWLSDGEFYVPDMAAFLAEIGAMAVCTYEGVPCAVIKGKGVVSLHKLLSEESKVRAIKP